MYTHTVRGKRVITRSKLGSRNDKLEKLLVRTKRQYNSTSLLHYMQVKLSGSVLNSNTTPVAQKNCPLKKAYLTNFFVLKA